MGQSEDKRRHPRVAHRIMVRSAYQQTLDLETIDLSAGGLCCTSPTFIPPMTRMALSLVLPAASGVASPDHQTISGEAVVVRTDPPPASKIKNGGYRVALFFSRMPETDRQTLLSFLRGRSGK